jgi:hypothetical protein
LSYIELGRGPIPRADKMMLISHALGVGVEDIMGEDAVAGVGPSSIREVEDYIDRCDAWSEEHKEHLKKQMRYLEQATKAQRSATGERKKPDAKKASGKKPAGKQRKKSSGPGVHG